MMGDVESKGVVSGTTDWKGNENKDRSG